MGRVFERILAGCNGTPESDHAVEVAIALAVSVGAKMTLLGVAVPPSAESLAEGYALPDPVKMKQRLSEQLARMAEAAKAQGVEIAVELVEGDPEKQIEKRAIAENVDLIVVGHRNVSRLRHWLEHSTGEALLNRAKTSVLVVHSPEKKK